MACNIIDAQHREIISPLADRFHFGAPMKAIVGGSSIVYRFRLDIFEDARAYHCQ